MEFKSRVQLRAGTVVYGELEGDYDVVLHATDLAAEGNALPAEAVCCLLKLEGIDFHRLLDSVVHGCWVLAQEWVIKGDSLVAEHVVKKRHHSILYLLCC